MKLPMTNNSQSEIESQKAAKKKARKIAKSIRSFFASDPPAVNILDDITSFLSSAVMKKMKRNRTSYKWDSDQDEACEPIQINKTKKQATNHEDSLFDYAYLYANIPQTKKTQLKNNECLETGHFSNNYDAQWTGTLEIRKLFEKKIFITSGLYFDASISTDKQPTFQLNLPLGHGLDLLNTASDFELTHDILLLYETAGGIEKVNYIFC